jgi:hypothetical protein
MIDDLLDGRKDFTEGRCDGYPQVPRQRTDGAAAVPVIVSIQESKEELARAH